MAVRVDKVWEVAVHNRSLDLRHRRSHWASSLFISQTSSLDTLKLQVESFLSRGHILGVSHVGGGYLRSLNIIVDRGQKCVFSSLGGLEYSHEVSLGLFHLKSVLQRQSSHST